MAFECGKVTRIQDGPWTLTGEGDTAAAAGEDLDKVIEQRCWAMLLWPLSEPCPPECSVKIVIDCKCRSSYGARLGAQPDEQVGDKFKAHATFEATATVLCLGPEAVEALDGDVPEHALPGEPRQPLSAKCGVSSLQNLDLQEVGPIRKTAADAGTAAEKSARRAAEEWVRDRLINVGCDPNCPVQVIHSDITTKVIATFNDPDKDEYTCIAQAQIRVRLCCYSRAEWAKVLKRLVEKGLVEDPAPLTPKPD